MKRIAFLSAATVVCVTASSANAAQRYSIPQQPTVKPASSVLVAPKINPALKSSSGLTNGVKSTPGIAAGAKNPGLANGVTFGQPKPGANLIGQDGGSFAAKPSAGILSHNGGLLKPR